MPVGGTPRPQNAKHRKQPHAKAPAPSQPAEAGRPPDRRRWAVPPVRRVARLRAAVAVAVAVAVNEPMRNDTSARQIVVTSFQCQNHLRFFFVISLYLKKVSLKR